MQQQLAVHYSFIMRIEVVFIARSEHWLAQAALTSLLE